MFVEGRMGIRDKDFMKDTMMLGSILASSGTGIRRMFMIPLAFSGGIRSNGV